MPTKNIVPRANNEGSIGTLLKRWGSAFFKDVDISGDMTAAGDVTATGDVSAANVTATGDVSAVGADLKSGSTAPVNTLQRSTAYSVGDIVYSGELNAKYFLKCTTAGTTDVTEPSFAGAASGTVITDGTAEFTVQTVLSLEDKEAQFIDDLIAKLQDTAATLPAGTAFTAATLLSKIISNMNTEDGVLYNLSNANAWYICLGAKYGGLIIQGGIGLSVSGLSSGSPKVATGTYSIAFTTTPVISVTQSADINLVMTSVGNVTTTNFSCNYSTYRNDSFSCGSGWLAVGY